MSTIQSDGKTSTAADTTPEAGEAQAASPQATTVQDSAVMTVMGEQVQVSDAAIGVLMAGEVEAEDTFILVGAIGSLSGDAQVLISPGAALAFGAGLALVMTLLGRLLGRRRSKDGEE